MCSCPATVTAARAAQLVQALLHHRQERERAILQALTITGPAGTHAIMNALYSQTEPILRRAAERNVLAHLLKLEAEGLVVRDVSVWRSA